MAKVGLTSIINSSFIQRITNAAKGSGSSSSTQVSQGKSNVSLSGGLRTSAKSYTSAVDNMNELISFLNLSKESLTRLGEIVDEDAAYSHDELDERNPQEELHFLGIDPEDPLQQEGGLFSLKETMATGPGGSVGGGSPP